MDGETFKIAPLRAAALLVACLLAFVQSSSYADGQWVRRNQPYRDLYYSASHRPRCTGDLYLPEAVTGGPIVILIHGGAWEAGDKSGPVVQDLSSRLVSAGYAVFNVNYRLIQDGGLFPYNIQDIRNAIDYVALNAQTFGVDKKRIALMGESAGGYLALMAGYSADSKIFRPRSTKYERASVRCVVCYYPVTDLINLEKGFVLNYLDDTECHNPKLYKIAEPKSYLYTAVATMVIHGTRDRLVPFEHSQRFVQEVAQHQCQAKLLGIDGAGHGFKYGDESNHAFEAARKFLDEHLK